MGVEADVERFLDNENHKSRGILRRVHLKKAYLLADIRKKTMGYFVHIIRHSTLQNALLEGKNRRQALTRIDVNRAYNRVVSRFGYAEATKDSKRQELLVTSDQAGLNLTTTNMNMILFKLYLRLYNIHV